MATDWAWEAALEINKNGDSANTVTIMEIVKKHFSRRGEVLRSVQDAALLISDARDRNGPPGNPPSMLWSALCSMWDHLDTLQQAIAAGEYSEAS